MFRWLKNRKEKKYKRRQEKHRRILEALKSKDTSGPGSDYGFYKDDFMFNCEIENKPHDYEEIDDDFSLPPQFSQIIGMDFRFRIKSEQPPELPSRTLCKKSHSLSVSACRDISNEDKFRERTISLPCFDRNRTQFPFQIDADEEPFYNEPWDCKSNLIVKRESQDCEEDTKEVVLLRLYEKVKGRKMKLESRNLHKNNIYSEIEDSDTGCESDAISQTGSEFSVFLNESKEVSEQSYTGDLTTSLRSLVTECGDVSDSDASSGFYDCHVETDEEHQQYDLKSFTTSQNNMYSPNFLRASTARLNTYPRSPCVKIDEDAELYLIPKRGNSLTESRSEILDLPVQKKKIRMEQRKIGSKNRNRVLDDLIWKNNFKL